MPWRGRSGLKAALDVADQHGETVLDRQLVGGDDQIGLLGRLVGARDAGELGNLAGPGPSVEALGIADLAGLERGLDVDLVEGVLGGRPCPLAVASVGRDEARDDEEAGVGEEARDLADPADVLGAVVGAEAEIGVEPGADIVAVQDVDLIALGEELALEGKRQRRLAGARRGR